MLHAVIIYKLINYLQSQLCLPASLPARLSTISVSTAVETDQYVCTGLEAYLLREPTAMEAMALVHSRILRVIFLHRNPEQGALGSVFSLHRLASLNHRFRVFQGVPDKEEEKEERIPGVEGL